MTALAVAFALLLAQDPCGQAMAEASARADQFDLAGAAVQARAGAAQGCGEATVVALYLQGLADARAAFRVGGAPAALAPVRQAVAALERIAAGRPGRAAIAALLLQAAAAGAQSERAEMALFLDSAARAEQIQRAAGQPPMPVVSAAEVAGDLWLQLFDYGRAREAYLAAVTSGRRATRATSGLARASARLGLEPAACMEYRRLMELWGNRTPRPAEIAEAEQYLQRAVCR